MPISDGQPVPVPLHRRRWYQFSLRTLLVVITAIAGWLSWQAWRAEQQMQTAAELDSLGVKVRWETRKPQRVWSLLGPRLGRRVVYADLPITRTDAALPLLKSLPNLRQVWIVEDERLDKSEYAEAIKRIKQALPNVPLFVDFDNPIDFLISELKTEPFVEEDEQAEPDEATLQRAEEHDDSF